MYDGRGSVAAEVSYNDSWYTFGGGIARKNVSSKSYTPFGEQIGEAVSGFGYNGEYYNDATGMIYLRARFYEPELNRFGQKDTLRGSVIDGISLNRYLYCQSDPVNFADYNGRQMVAVNVADGGGVKKSSLKDTIANAVNKTTKTVKGIQKKITDAVKRITTSPVAFNSMPSSSTRPLLTPEIPSVAQDTSYVCSRGIIETDAEKVYIFYPTRLLKGNSFSSQANFVANQLTASGKEVTMIRTNTILDLYTAWESMPYDVNEVFLFSHGNGHSLWVNSGTGDGSLSHKENSK